jgi:hypothetical protein
MPRLAALGLGLGVDEEHSPPSQPRGRAAGGAAREWGRRLKAAGVETAEELLVLAPDSAGALLSSGGEGGGEEGGLAPRRRVGRKVSE